MQNVIHPVILAGALKSRNILGVFDYAYGGVVALIVRADGADRLVGQVLADRTAVNGLVGL